jgi:very-short-patch-repair endonuclease
VEQSQLDSRRPRDQPEAPPHEQHTIPLAVYRARTLRRNETDAERKLWQQLRANRFEALRFRRQVPIGDFIVDFCCRARKLI